mgnify:FL=1|jgi:hypothetical protein
MQGQYRARVEWGKKKSDGFHLPLSPDFGVVARSLPAPGRTAQPRRINLVSPTGINTGHHEKVRIHRPSSLARTVAQCELTGVNLQ